MNRYINHFYSRFKYAVIGWYIAIVFSVTFTLVVNGIYVALFLFLTLELIFSVIMIITYLVEKHVTKTYK